MDGKVMNNKDSTNDLIFEVPVVNLNDSDEQDDCNIIDLENSEEIFCSNTIKITNKSIEPTSIVLDDDSEKEDDQFEQGDIFNQIKTNNNKMVANIFSKKLSNLIKSKHKKSAAIILRKAQESISSCNNKHSKSILEKSNDDAIVIEESSAETDNDCECESNRVTNKNQTKHITTSKHNKVVGNYDEICKQNKILGELIEKCLDMENSMGMLRIINRTLIPIYLDTSKDFKNSIVFQRYLTKILKKLDTEPHRKFTHMKELCEVMKDSKQSKVKKALKLSSLHSESNGKNVIIAH